MPNTFEAATKMVAQCMDPDGRMIPVRSFVDNDRYDCFCIVEKTFWGYKPIYNNLMIQDIVECDDLVKTENLGWSKDGNHAAQVRGKVDSHVAGEVEALQIKIEGSKSDIRERDLKVQRYSIPQKHLGILSKRKLKRKLPPLFEQLRQRKCDLYMVTEILKNQEQIILKNNSGNSFWSKLPFFSFKRNCKDESELQIPSHQVLAYRVEQLFFHEKDMMNLYLNKKKSFPKAASTESNSNSEDSGNVKKVVEDMEESLQDLTEKQKEDMQYCPTQCLHKDEWLQNMEQRGRAVALEMPKILSFVAILNKIEVMFDQDHKHDFLNDARMVMKNAELIQKFLEILKELSKNLQTVAEKNKLPKLKVEHLLEQSAKESLEVMIQDLEEKTLALVLRFHAIMGLLWFLSRKSNYTSYMSA